MSESCIFCDIVSGKAPAHKVWEDDNFLAFLTIRPVNEGHTLLIPKEHHEYVFDMQESDYSELLKAARMVSQYLKDAFQPPRVGLVVEGFSVSHVHLHLVPVFQVAELDPNRGHMASSEELSPVAERIRRSVEVSLNT